MATKPSVKKTIISLAEMKLDNFVEYIQGYMKQREEAEKEGKKIEDEDLLIDAWDVLKEAGELILQLSYKEKKEAALLQEKFIYLIESCTYDNKEAQRIKDDCFKLKGQILDVLCGKPMCLICQKPLLQQ